MAAIGVLARVCLAVLCECCRSHVPLAAAAAFREPLETAFPGALCPALVCRSHSAHRGVIMCQFLGPAVHQAECPLTAGGLTIYNCVPLLLEPGCLSRIIGVDERDAHNEGEDDAVRYHAACMIVEPNCPIVVVLFKSV